MKVNTQRTINRSSAQSQESNKYFNSLTQILLPATVSNNSIFINSKFPPSIIFWLGDEHPTTGEITNSYVDIKPQKTTTDDVVGATYSLAKDFSAKKAYYVPSEDLLLSRLISDLNISMPKTSNLAEQINFLGVKLEETNKNLSTWDTYNIYKVAYNREELVSALAALPLSSSVLINTDEAQLEVGSWKLQKGDMLVKDAWGSLHQLKGSNGGYYFPSSITPFAEGDSSNNESGLFQVNFTYTQETPLPDTKTITNEASTELQVPYNTIKVQFPTVEQEEVDVTCYSYHGTLSANTSSSNIPFIKSKDEKTIEPVVYYYLTTGERIIMEQDYIIGSNAFSVKNATKMDVLCEVR